MEGNLILVPIMVLGLAVTAMISGVIIKLQRLKVEEARIRAGESSTDELAQQVAQLQQEVGELQERIDFNERMLAQLKERPGIVPPRSE